jgi:hypothetical protein
VEVQQQIADKCYSGDETSCSLIKAEIAATLVALGLVAAPEIVAAIVAKAGPRATATASTTGTVAARAGQKLFQPEEVELLRRFFGQGLEGARAATLNFKLPQGARS